jgi:hypothetical protein
MQDLPKCTKVVGFLFPHPCGRVSSVGCPYCDYQPNKTNYFNDPNHPYQADRNLYPGFGVFSYAGKTVDLATIQFTDADGLSLGTTSEFEQDLGAS